MKMSRYDNKMDVNAWFGLFVIAAIAVAVVAAPFTLRGCVPDYASGERIGTIYKFSRKGVFWKSWEGEAMLTTLPMNGGSGGMLPGVGFTFSTLDQSVADKIDAALAENRPVVLKYRGWLIGPVWISTSHEVIDVVPAKH